MFANNTSVEDKFNNNFSTKIVSNYSDIIIMSDNNDSDSINITFLCPIYSDSDRFWKEAVAFWLDGVIKTIVAFIGILMNILAAYILIQPKMKNSFNLSLVALNIIDTIFLLGSIMESFELR